MLAMDSEDLPRVRKNEIIQWCSELGLTYEDDEFLGLLYVFTDVSKTQEPYATFRRVEDEFYVLNSVESGTSWAYYGVNNTSDVQRAIESCEIRVSNMKKLADLLRKYKVEEVI